MYHLVNFQFKSTSEVIQVSQHNFAFHWHAIVFENLSQLLIEKVVA